MRQSRFTEEQVIAILRTQESGIRTADVCRQHGISGAIFHKYKSKYSGLDVSEARRLKALEDEDARLKKLLAKAMLDNTMQKDIASKNGNALIARRGAPLTIVRDNGTEFTGMAILSWSQEARIEWHCIAPTKIPRNQK